MSLRLLNSRREELGNHSHFKGVRPGACTTPPSSLPSAWSAAPDVWASDSQDCLWIIKPTLKIVPASKLKAPHRTCAVATSAALLLQMVAAPRAACRQITPHHAPAKFAGKELPVVEAPASEARIRKVPVW